MIKFTTYTLAFAKNDLSLKFKIIEKTFFWAERDMPHREQEGEQGRVYLVDGALEGRQHTSVMLCIFDT